MMVKQILLSLVCVFISMGMKAQTARWVVKPRYVSIVSYTPNMYKVKTGNQVGILDQNGAIIVAVSADSITDIKNGHALIMNYVDGRFRLAGVLHADKKVSVILQEYYVNDYPFYSEDKLPVYNNKGKYGYIDPYGKEVVSFDYVEIHPFCEGWASVTKGKGGFLGTIGDAANSLMKKKAKGILGYVNERGEMMTLQKSLGKLQDAYSFKGGEALVISEDNKFNFINYRGQVIRIDNTVVLAADDMYALGTNGNTKTIPANISTFDGPTTYSSDGLFGYKSGSKIILPAQFEKATPFGNGYAIASIGGKYGILQLLSDNFECKLKQLGTTVGSGEDVMTDYEVTVPDEWKNSTLNLICKTEDGTRLNCSRQGDASIARSFSFMLPKKGKRELILEGDELVVWQNNMPTSSMSTIDEVSIVITPSTVKANEKDIASVSVRITNNTAALQKMTVRIVANNIKDMERTITISSGQTEKIYVNFIKIMSDETRKITVTVLPFGKSVSANVNLKPFFSKF